MLHVHINKPIRLRLIASIVLFSSAVTVVLTGIQLYYEYLDQKAHVTQDFQRASGLYKQSLAAAMWELNSNLVELQLDGLYSFNAITYLELTDSSGSRRIRGTPPTHIASKQEIPIEFATQNKLERVGTLTIYSDQEILYAYLRARIGMVLINNAVKTFIVTLFLLWLFQQQVTKPLTSLAHFSHTLARGKENQAKELAAPLQTRPDDEIKLVWQAINDLYDQLKVTHLELQKQQWELAHAARLSTLGEMAASIAHELGQPLNSIANFAFAAHRQLGESPAASRNYVDKINDEAKRAGQILRNLRDFARHHVSETHVHNLGDLMDEAIGLVHHVAESYQVHIDKGKLPPGFTAVCDRTQILQVMVNILRNAFQALAKVPPERRRVSIDFLRYDNKVEVVIRDHGPGIQIPEDQLFMSFATSKKDGLGLGLRICRSIMEAHQGGITFEHAEPGAIFRLFLPSPPQLATVKV